MWQFQPSQNTSIPKGFSEFKQKTAICQVAAATESHAGNLARLDVTIDMLFARLVGVEFWLQLVL